MLKLLIDNKRKSINSFINVELISNSARILIGLMLAVGLWTTIAFLRRIVVQKNQCWVTHLVSFVSEWREKFLWDTPLFV